MSWTLLENTQAPMMRWQATLTEAAPDAGAQGLALIHSPTLHIEGELGGGVVEVRGSNSGEGWLPLASVDHEDLVSLQPVYWLSVRVVDATPETRIRLTVAGRR